MAKTLRSYLVQLLVGVVYDLLDPASELLPGEERPGGRPVVEDHHGVGARVQASHWPVGTHLDKITC